MYNEVIERELDTVVPHIERYIIAFAEHDDSEMQRQLEWAKGKAQEGELLNAATVAAMGRGQMRRAQALFSQAEQVGLKNGLPQFAGTCSREYAEFAADIGLSTEARLSHACQRGRYRRDPIVQSFWRGAHTGQPEVWCIDRLNGGFAHRYIMRILLLMLVEVVPFH